MKVRILFFTVFVSIFGKAQINENFADGDFTNNPQWAGLVENFVVNEKYQLQANATSTSLSSLFTNSESIKNAEWNTQFIINYRTSSSNYAAMYIVSDTENPASGCNGYFVQVGGTNDEISLFMQQGTKKTKIIDGVDKRIDDDSVNVSVRVTRDESGNFELWSRKNNETEYLLEGKTQNTVVSKSYYFALVYSNTSTTGKAYIFDNILVTGEKADDWTNPEIEYLKIKDVETIEIKFNERIINENTEIVIDGKKIDIDNIAINDEKNKLVIRLKYKFTTGNKYEINVTGITDYSGNYLINNTRYSGMPEDAEVGDLVWNEIMFNHPENSSEYVEIFNKSSKVVELTDFYVSTQKTDGQINTSNKINDYLLLFPFEYIAFSTSPDSVRKHHNCPEEANVQKLQLSSLNNTSTTLVLYNNNMEIIYDELTYDEKWHHTLVKNPKGVALEKINPDMETQNSASWHSAGSTTNYGTPGYKNSQYREIHQSQADEKTVWLN